LGAALIALMASGCVSRATAGSLMRETGNVFTARGVLEAAHVLGHGCDEDEGSSQRNVALCGSGGGGSNAGANLASLGVGTARVAMGLALVALADATTPTVQSKPLLVSAVTAAPGALDRYEDPRQRSSWLAVQSAACLDRATCPSSLDPRRAIPVDSHLGDAASVQHFRGDAAPQ
jgi:hypothetical protein